MTEAESLPVLARFDAVPESWRRAVVAIGNFDGVHAGHQAVLAAAYAQAGEIGAPLVMMTFEPHPRTFFQPDAPIFRLTSAPVKAAVACACGTDGVLVLPFDTTLSTMSADDFVRDILIGRLQIRHAVTGYDFHFGHKRQGTPDYLERAGAQNRFGVTIVAEHGDEGGAVSSSRIRNALAEGNVEEANHLLDWTWSVAGQIRHGEKRGREMGFPTANMVLDPSCGLRHGIYSVRLTRADGTVHGGVASYGRRPTFDNGNPLLETFLFGFSGDLYGETVLVSLVRWIRPEQKFDTVDALVAQMEDDSAKARMGLADTPPIPVDRDIRRFWTKVAAAGSSDGSRHAEHI
jgi:riboflavin kinase/FMN adenylyltransferase